MGGGGGGGGGGGATATATAAGHENVRHSAAIHSRAPLHREQAATPSSGTAGHGTQGYPLGAYCGAVSTAASPQWEHLQWAIGAQAVVQAHAPAPPPALQVIL